MNEAKIHLSPAEMELVQNAEWILTKNGILDKVRDLLSDLQQKQLELVKQQAGIPDSQPKISRGENYKGLPYMILDFPRLFEHHNIFAVRSLFWWGHFFSITLHISGERKRAWEENLIRQYNHIAASGFYLCIMDDPWEHHFESDNYRKVSEMNADEFEKFVRKNDFVKLAARTELNHWDTASQFLVEKFKEITGWLRH